MPDTRSRPHRARPAPADLPRRLLAEALGTGLLVTVVVGSGIAAQRLSPQDVGLQLLENSTATAFGLTVLILWFGPVSGAHFNPVVSAADWILGRRVDAGLTGREVGAYAVAQVVGAVAGAELANLMYQVSVGRLATTDRTGAHLLLGEVVATAGLVGLVFALARTGRGLLAAPAVGAYIGAGYWFTSSTSFANPAVTIGRMFSDSFAGIAPGSVPGFVGAQLVGLVLAVALTAFVFPDVGDVADDIVVPHPTDADADQERSVTRTSSRANTAEGTPGSRPVVVYACRANGGRSVISRVLTEHYAGGRVVALSAGTEPGEHVHPEVARVLEQLGLDTSREEPKLLTSEMIATSDLAVTMGCGENCPYVPGARYRDWPLDDPKGQDDATVRRIVADIDTRVRGLLVELVPDIELPPSLVATP
ncbi:MAG: aquaporin [Nocardioides sp.]